MNSIDALVFFVLKKNDNLKLCINYRNLNKITKKIDIFHY